MNDLMQRWVGGRRNLGQHIDAKVELDWLVHMTHLRSIGFDVKDIRMLEVGSGWLPVMPLCFALAGVRHCVSMDLHHHLRASAVPLALDHIERHIPAIAKAAGREESAVHADWRRWRQIEDGNRILQAASIEYRAPADATRTGLPDACIDLVFSNSVLEHVPSDVLDRLMVESARILRPGGVALHGVNCGDHYAYFDRSITAINYLRFPQAEWKKWNNDILFQNRLRSQDFIAAARRGGLEIVMDSHRPREQLLRTLKDFPVAPEFRHYSDDELCCTSIDFAARRPAPGRAA